MLPKITRSSCHTISAQCTLGVLYYCYGHHYKNRVVHTLDPFLLLQKAEYQLEGLYNMLFVYVLAKVSLGILKEIKISPHALTYNSKAMPNRVKILP